MELIKRFLNHKGVDLKSSDLLRSPDYASDMRNAQYSDGGALEKRRGYQACGSSCGGYGLFTYRRVDPTSGVADPQVLTIDNNLWKKNTSSFTVSYSGSDNTCVLSFFLDSDTLTYKLQVLVGTSLVIDEDVGVGFDEVSVVTLADFKTVVDAVTDFSATIVGDVNVPASFLKIIREQDLNVADWASYAQYWTMANTPLSNPLQSYLDNQYQDDHENVSSIQINNAIYFGTGYNELYKYDGQTFFRAGMPTPGALAVSVSAGAVTGSNYIHKIQYAQYDAAGNIVEGNLKSSSAVTVAAKQFDLTVPQIEYTTGFNTNCAIVAGAQVSVTTITVDNGSGGANTFNVGDTAYFFDSISGAYVSRKITARTNLAITIEGAAVTISDNAVISNNLRILIWRSKDSGSTPSLFYLVDEIPNNSFVSSVAYADNKLDSALGELLLNPGSDRSLPPKGKYVSQWNGQLFIGGKIDDPTILAWSDIDGPEYFPIATNQIYVEPGNGDIITGIAPNNEVFTVHGDASFTVISGDIGSGQIRVETRARDIGCAAHATIQDLDGILVWLSPRGPVQSSGGQIPLPLGAAIDPSESNQASRIDPEFDNDGKVENERLRLKRSVGYNDTSSDKYILFVPAEDGDDSLRYPNQNSLCFVYDRVRDAWLIWDNWNMAGGMTEFENELYFSERRYSNFEGEVQSILYRKHNLIDAFDYADNNAAVDFDYSPQWEFLGEPSVLKDPIAIKIYSLETVANNEFSLTVEQEVNFQSDSATATFVMDIAGGGYGYSAYGEDPYSDPSQDSYTHPLARARQRSVRPRFKNSVIHEAVLITGWEIEFSVPYRPEFKP